MVQKIIIIKNSHVMASIRKFFVKDHSYNRGDGSPKREFLHVDDLGDATVFCLENWDPNKYRYLR